MKVEINNLHDAKRVLNELIDYIIDSCEHNWQRVGDFDEGQARYCLKCRKIEYIQKDEKIDNV